MSKNDLDLFEGSHLPADLLTPTLGSNYGMDGYPDLDYNAGVLNAVVDPELHPAPALPTGVAMTAAAEMDLADILKGENLADLEWLDPSQAQDPERLPHPPEMIPELVQAWGVERRTNGVEIVASTHQTDLDRARYEDTLENKTSTKKATARTMTKVLTHAMRRSVEGQHVDRIVREACESMGDEFRRIVPHLRHLKDEHGLVGNVFVRAAAYPGWAAGKGKAHVKRYASSAKYIIVTARDLDQATWIQNGRCAYTGKVAVTEIPWTEAYAHYAPRLRATGRKVASGNPREALKAAFLSDAVSTHREGHKPREAREGDVSFGHEFRQQFDVASEAVGVKHAASADAFQWDVDPMAARLKKAGELDSALASVVAERGRTASYKGDVFHAATASRTEVRLSDENEAISKAASASGVSANEIRGTLRGLRRAMSEGMAGKDLSSYVSLRFASSVVEAAKDLISDLRGRHEGGSGFLYVDAEAYASESGVAGCTKAAAKHRTNQIPAVAAMDRCATCTLVRTMPDGTRKCGTYNKALMEDTQGADIEKIKRANIASSDMSDAEVTASLFAPSYDPSEFNLHNANLEDIEQAPLPEIAKMSEIAFDGWDI